mmetsp:Transcript_29869/g.60234  ORF Transcript_29869/g.60234 Transcript_29869/m.60234 type:complete len:456 (+) Transcript_29869:129-1496(+)
MNTRSRRVAVVGGGPAGVVSCRFLAEAGHEPVVFESGPEVGGIWAPEPTNKVVYSGLVTNLPTIVMQSFDLDFKPGLPSYIKTADYGRYMVDYVEHFGLRRYVQCGASVTQIDALKSEDEEADGEAAWRVRWARRPSHGSDKLEHCEDEFDAVLVASGHYDTPYEPEVPGQAAWLAAEAPGRRTVTHAQRYDRPEQHASRAVLVVGGRSSAVDIARELRGAARWVYVLEKGCEEVRTVGSCTYVPFGAALSPSGRLVLGDVELDGPPVEDLILATGYVYRYPFLDSEQLGLDFGPVGRYVAPLHMHVLHARRPSLAFVGIPLAVPCPIPLFEAQARYVASHLRCASSTTAEREAWVDARRVAVGSRPQDMHFLSSVAWAYMRELTKMSGMDAADYEAYCRRLALVEAVYKDRCSKRPQLPWDDDWYRRCEYSADWDAGEFRVTLGEDAPTVAIGA